MSRTKICNATRNSKFRSSILVSLLIWTKLIIIPSTDIQATASVPNGSITSRDARFLHLTTCFPSSKRGPGQPWTQTGLGGKLGWTSLIVIYRDKCRTCGISINILFLESSGRKLSDRSPVSNLALPASLVQDKVGGKILFKFLQHTGAKNCLALAGAPLYYHILHYLEAGSSLQVPQPC